VSKPNPNWLRPGALIRVAMDKKPWYGEVVNVKPSKHDDSIVFMLVRSPRGILGNRQADWVTYDPAIVSHAEVIDAVADAKSYIDNLSRNRDAAIDLMLGWLGRLK